MLLLISEFILIIAGLLDEIMKIYLIYMYSIIPCQLVDIQWMVRTYLLELILIKLPQIVWPCILKETIVSKYNIV